MKEKHEISFSSLAAKKSAAVNLILEVKQVTHHNTQYVGNLTNYQQAINHLSYIDQKQFHNQFAGLMPLVGTKPQNIRVIPSECRNLPSYKNWINDRKIPPVKNQKNCNSSFLLSAVSALESAVAIEYGENITELSVQHCLECLKNMTGRFSGCRSGR